MLQQLLALEKKLFKKQDNWGGELWCSITSAECNCGDTGGGGGGGKLTADEAPFTLLCIVHCRRLAGEGDPAAQHFSTVR